MKKAKPFHAPAGQKSLACEAGAGPKPDRYVASRNSGPSPGGISYSLFNATIIAYPPGRSQTLFGKSLPAVHDLIFPGFMDTEIGFCPAWFKPIERPINVRRPASHGRSYACGAGDTAASNMGPGCWHPGASRRGSWSIQVKLGRCHKGSEINIQCYEDKTHFRDFCRPGTCIWRMFVLL